MIGRFFPILPPYHGVEKVDKDKVDKGEKSSRKMIGRFFPILPPYHGVDFGANFNRLKSSGAAAYFLVRDSIVVDNAHLEITILNKSHQDQVHLAQRTQKWNP